ncbi:MAG: hypothetical protein KI786_11885, partial [Mameliella sp.]|nr:hypothetical protein [Phaeodactylibacter sp.]
RVDAQLDELFDSQQVENGNNGAESPQMAYGGWLKKYSEGGQGSGDPPEDDGNPFDSAANVRLPAFIQRKMYTPREFGTVEWGGGEMQVMRTQIPDGNNGFRYRSRGDNARVTRMGNTSPEDFVRNTLRLPDYEEPTGGPVIPDDPNANRVLPSPGGSNAPGRTSFAESLGVADPGTSNRVLPTNPGQRSTGGGSGRRRTSAPSTFRMGDTDILKKALGMKPEDLRKLNSGDSTALQKALTLNGWELPKYGVDGSVGDETIGALDELRQARPSDAMLQPMSNLDTRRPDNVASLNTPGVGEADLSGYRQRKGLLGTLRDLTSEENLRTVRDIMGGVIPYAQYANAQKTARRMTAPPSPQYARAVPLQTDINVNDQLKAAREAERGFNRNIANNTTNSANANSMRLSGLIARLNNEGGIREGERNMEVQLGNQAAQVNAGIDQANTQLGNQYRGMRNDFNNNRQLFRNRAFQELGNTALGQIMDSRLRQRDNNVLQAYSKMFDGNLVYRNMADLAASDKSLQKLFGEQNLSDSEKAKAISFFKERGYSDEEIQEFLKLTKNG